MEKNLPSIERSTSINKIRKILGKIALHGEVYKNRG